MWTKEINGIQIDISTMVVVLKILKLRKFLCLMSHQRKQNNVGLAYRLFLRL